MKLTELEPVWIKRQVEEVDPTVYVDDVMHPSGKQISHVPVTMQEADGIRFLCPKCVNTDGHSVICWFESKVADDVQPGPGRWNPQGTSFEDLSFVPGAKTRSIQLLGGCNHHFFITNGDVHE